jgi:hypothetical protein
MVLPVIPELIAVARSFHISDEDLMLWMCSAWAYSRNRTARWTISVTRYGSSTPPVTTSVQSGDAASEGRAIGRQATRSRYKLTL